MQRKTHAEATHIHGYDVTDVQVTDTPFLGRGGTVTTLGDTDICNACDYAVDHCKCER